MTIKPDQSIEDCKALSWSDSTVVEQKYFSGYSGKALVLQKEIHVTCEVELIIVHVTFVKSTCNIFI